MPWLDVSANSGQVSVVLDPVRGKHRSSGPSGGSGGKAAGGAGGGAGAGVGGGKMDWVIIMEFERPVEPGSERGFTKVSLFKPFTPDHLMGRSVPVMRRARLM